MTDLEIIRVIAVMRVVIVGHTVTLLTFAIWFYATTAALALPLPAPAFALMDTAEASVRIIILVRTLVIHVMEGACAALTPALATCVAAILRTPDSTASFPPAIRIRACTVAAANLTEQIVTAATSAPAQLSISGPPAIRKCRR